MAIIAPAISCIAFLVALNGERCSSSILAWTASITTIASSTTTPIAKTKANNVIKFKEISKNCMNTNVPTSETGTAIAGITVERQSPKKRKTTNPTKIKASIKVWITFSIEASKNLETSYEIS
ncbi:hypothetical protein D3C86_1071600 [compost metagenome]